MILGGKVYDFYFLTIRIITFQTAGLPGDISPFLHSNTYSYTFQETYS